MFTKEIRRLLSLLTASVLLLSACSCAGSTPGGSDALTWGTWNGYNRFWDLVGETHPDIEVDFVAYAGANQTGYSWARMRAGDITDLFSTSQILDEDLAKERLADLSGYGFMEKLSTSVLDQVSIDGGIYLLPVSNTMYGILYNKTLMEENGWEAPRNFEELEALCAEIRQAGLLPGVIGTKLTGNAFSAVFNLAKTSWLATQEGASWERDFLTGNAAAAGAWEGTMEYVQKYIDIGMFNTSPEDLANGAMLEEYLGGRKAVFFTAAFSVNSSVLSNGDELGLMPYLGEGDGQNIYMYSLASYIGISKRLTEPGSEKKLEKALRLLELLYSPEGQAAFASEDTPCVLGMLKSSQPAEDALVYGAWQAIGDGRAFRMTYAGWENILADIGQAYKDWFRGENDMDAAKCIAQMDRLQSSFLSSQDIVYFCESTADFTLEETAELVGKALGSGAGADAAMIAYGTAYKEGGFWLNSGVTGKLYKERINADVSTAIAPATEGEYAVMTMTGAQAKELAAAGADLAGDGQPFPYVLTVRGGGELEDGETYRVAFVPGSYTEEVGQTYPVQIEKGSLRGFLRAWLEEQKTVSPGGNPWE